MFNKKTKNADPRKESEPMEGGRREGETQNPYLAARRTWNSHIGDIINQRRMWQIIALLASIITLAAIAGLIYIGSQSKFVPYVIEVDSHGRAVGIGTATPTPNMNYESVTKRVIEASIVTFITDARTVTADVDLQVRMINRVYNLLAPGDPAIIKMNEWFNSNEKSSPFERAKTELVNVRIKNVLQQSTETWLVEWEEITRDRTGALIKTPELMKAVITVYMGNISSGMTPQQLIDNPMAVFVKNYSWSIIQ